MGGHDGEVAYIYILSGIAVLILAVACINFTTLAIGRAATRAREITPRKTVGASRLQVVQQLLGESILQSYAATVGGVLLAEFLLPTYNQLVQRQLAFDYGSALNLAVLSLTPLLIGLGAGAYPAAVLSGLHPVAVLRNVIKLGGWNRFSQGLVIVQFALSTLLMITTLTMARQVSFMKGKDVGFDDELIVSVRLANVPLEVFKSELLPHPEIVSVSGSWPGPGVGRGSGPARWKLQGRDVTVHRFWVDPEYLGTLGMELVNGIDFAELRASDRQGAAIVNQTLAAMLGQGEVVGHELGADIKVTQAPATIIGVVEDFHFFSVRHQIPPAVLYPSSPDHPPHHMTVRVDPSRLQEAIALLRETWQRLCPGDELRYLFVDEDFDSQFKEEERWERIISYSAVFAMFITCLGLLGMVSLAVSRRTKEIGIRKVLGASVSSIVRMLSRELTWLVLASNVIAWPLAHHMTTAWLDNYAYRIDVGLELFLLGGALLLIIAWVTGSAHAVKAALANPVDSLRSE